MMNRPIHTISVLRRVWECDQEQARISSKVVELSKKSITINREVVKVSAQSIYRGVLGGEVRAIKTISTTKSGETQFPKKTVAVAPISAVCNLTCVT